MQKMLYLNQAAGTFPKTKGFGISGYFLRYQREQLNTKTHTGHILAQSSTWLKPSQEHDGHVLQAGPLCIHPSELQLLWAILCIAVSYPKVT